MSNNRIITRPRPGDENQPVTVGMCIKNNKVELTFEPAAVLLRFAPREARLLAIGLLQRADMCEHPPEELPPEQGPPEQEGS